jgi:hypothetical protein
MVKWGTGAGMDSSDCMIRLSTMIILTGIRDPQNSVSGDYQWQPYFPPHENSFY